MNNIERDGQNTADTLETNQEPTNKLFVPFLGQSNATLMSSVFEPYKPGMTVNDKSGGIVLDETLTSLTGNNVLTSDSEASKFGIAGGRVSGDGGFKEDSQVFWYPDRNQPGGALLQTEQKLEQWLSTQEAQPTDEIAIIWAQGESDAISSDLGEGDPVAREQYKQSTLAVFDYLKNSLDYENIKFYVEPTGGFQEEAAANIGYSPQGIEVVKQGVKVVREVQAEIALSREDILLTTDYSDLRMIYDEGVLYGDSYDRSPDVWSKDIWHVGHDGMKVNGARLAEYIALDRGENNVISFTDDLGNPAQATSITRAGLLDINIADRPSSEMILGTENPDLLVGTTSEDNIVAGSGNDIIMGGQGIDSLTGAAGDDIYFFDASISADVASHQDRILDFELNKDRLDVSVLMELTDNPLAYTVASQYLIFNPLSENSLEIQFDLDGMGEQTADTFVTLENVDSQAFLSDVSSQLIVAPIEI